ncbi:MAG: hypothetical protein HY785_16860 [Oscillatoriophycideae cyanobacterium NC_groundwater_1537_Pr4_S-0.65um_50_18]|nr:hypothetical protein [Oscillatoriophycideae cyanobacterium NC_groundwater_1537_Pr4_S-0.65um_50_18]
MKPTLSWLEYQQLELILPAKVVKPSWRDRIWQVWQTAVSYFTESRDIQISCTRDIAGKVWWSGYDPQTQRSLHHVSEQEIRAWIERRYS